MFQDEPTQKPQTPAKIDFPDLKCPVHRSNVIIVCMNPSNVERIFLCASCITEFSAKLKDFEPMVPYDKFVEFIQEPSGLLVEEEENSSNLLSQKNTNISNFQNHINQQKFEINQTIKDLDKDYKNKCSALSETLQEKLEGQKDIFSKNYEKFSTEIKSDKERDAEVPKFNEIKSKIVEINDHQKIEDYMRSIIKRKQQWKKASEELRTTGRRTERFYKSQIENQLNNQPKFAASNIIIDMWNNGLQNLINRIERQADCFENMYSEESNIDIAVNNLDDLELITNKMIKDESRLVLDLRGQKLSQGQCTIASVSIQRLTHLKYLVVDLTSAQITDETLGALFGGIKYLTQMQTLEVVTEGTKNKGVLSNQLAVLLPNLVNLTSLRLNYTLSDLHDETATTLAKAVEQLVQLRDLRIQFQSNGIKEAGAKSWGAALEKLVNVQNLHLNLGGYSAHKNRIKDEGAIAIAKGLGCMAELQTLYLDLSFNGIHSTFTQEFSLSFRKLSNLKSAQVLLNNNNLNEKGAKKIGKAITSLTNLRNVQLNMNNNDIKKDGVSQLTNAFRGVDHISNLTIYLRTVGINQEEGEIQKQNLSNGRNYETLNFYY